MSFPQETFRILRFIGLPAFGVLLVATLIDQSLTSRLEILMRSEAGVGSELWILAALSIGSSLFFPVLVTSLAFLGLLKHRGLRIHFGSFLGNFVPQICIETLRSWGSVMRWAIFLILPALIRMFQLVFVPYVVCFHRGYENGQADALRISRTYVGKSWVRILGVALAFQLILPLILTTFLDEYRTFRDTPLAATFCLMLDLVLAIVFIQILFRVFESVQQELGDESVFQLERNPGTT